MSKPFRLASAASLVALAPMIASCAVFKPSAVTTSGFGGQADGEVGLATRALAALEAKNYPAAVSLAERAVERTPSDAGFRGLLGNAYFAAGRFASAEAAFKDSLAIYSNQPQVVLKLALAQIAQGKHAEAASVLEAARTQMDPADFGLALALAGRPAEAIPVLETAARIPNAGARVRQNLALALALAGDWSSARVVAAQDIPANQLDARLQQWMQLAKPARASDQVAALTGVTPAAADPGQPTRLALRRAETQVAEAAPAPQSQAVAAPEYQAAAPPPPPPVQLAEAAPPAEPYYTPPPPPPPPVAEAPAFAPPPPPPPPSVAKPAKLHRGSITVKLPPVRKASLPVSRGKSSAVVQLGAYGSPQRVLAAWNAASRKHARLRAYAPMSARFDSPRGTVYRLSVKGFGSAGEANALCAALRRAGGSCFVRTLAGDAPVRIASR